MWSYGTVSSPADTVKGYVLVTTAAGSFLGAFMFTSVNVAIPSLVDAFETAFNVVQWVVLAYMLATGTLMLIVGRLADMVGKKVLYVAGYATFLIGTLLCALSPTVSALILSRAVQGLGAASMTALGLAILTDVFPDGERGRAIGINGSILSVGIVAGPSLGGFLVDAFSWQWIFWVAVPVGALTTLLAIRFVPHYQRTGDQRFDILGAALLFGVLLTLSLALTLGQDLGFGSAVIVVLFAACAVLTVLFVTWQRRARNPVLDLRLFRNTQLTIGLVTGFTTFLSISGVIFLMPFYLENVLGYAPRNVGLLMSVVPFFLIFIAPLAGAAADRFGERPVTIVGMTLLLAGYLALSSLSEQTTALGYVLRFLAVGLGMGIFQTPNNSAIMGSVPRERSGVAGGLLALTRSLGQISGIAILGTLWATRVLARLEGPVTIGATVAPSAFQVAGLHDMLVVIQIAIAAGLAVVLWDAGQHRRRAAVEAGAKASG